MLTPEEITAVAYRALEDKKAKDVKILKTAEHTVLADYCVICNGSSSTHIKALVDELTSLGWVFTYIGANQDSEKTACKNQDRFDNRRGWWSTVDR